MTMTNAEWMINNGYEFSSLQVLPADKGKPGYKICLRTEKGRFAKIGEIDTFFSNRATTVLFWLDAEHKEQILDDAKKRYLSAVVRPFRDEKFKIVKHSARNGSEERLDFISENVSFYLPNFKASTMYKGMKRDKLYTLKELGL